MLNYVKNQITTKLGMLNWKETPDLRDNFTEYKKEILLHLAKILQTFATHVQQVWQKLPW